MADSCSISIPDIRNKEEKLKYLRYIVSKGGPDTDDCEYFTSVINSAENAELDEYRSILKPILNANTLIGHGFEKPYGYPGDFSLINKIYSHHVSPHPEYRKWDLFFQNQAGACAVRNRKESFIRHCESMIKSKKDTYKVLVLGSGPGTDVKEILEKFRGSNISFDLVDFDQNAINFSLEQNRNFSDRISFNRINVLRFKPHRLYDLIWSAGLFDYFKDKHFVFLIRKYVEYLADDGEMVVSNFNTTNPTKRLMEVLSDWYLNHRSKSDLINLAKESVPENSLISVDSEPLEVNLFLKIRLNGKNKV